MDAIRWKSVRLGNKETRRGKKDMKQGDEERKGGEDIPFPGQREKVGGASGSDTPTHFKM